MIVVGRTILERYEDLWDLMARAQPLLGGTASLMALVEHATASRLEPWAELSREAWTQGRVFGERGELRWRAYGPLLRAVLVTEAEAESTASGAGEATSGDRIEVRLHGLGFPDTMACSLTVEEEDILLWQGPYATAHVRRYLDADGYPAFVRYYSVT
jgi:hypothetical protein